MTLQIGLWQVAMAYPETPPKAPHKGVEEVISRQPNTPDEMKVCQYQALLNARRIINEEYVDSVNERLLPFLQKDGNPEVVQSLNQRFYQRTYDRLVTSANNADEGCGAIKGDVYHDSILELEKLRKSVANKDQGTLPRLCRWAKEDLMVSVSAGSASLVGATITPMIFAIDGPSVLGAGTIAKTSLLGGFVGFVLGAAGFTLGAGITSIADPYIDLERY